MLADSQQPLPPDLHATLAEAVEHSEPARLQAALELARRLGYV
jgi:hypothetical protein